MVVKPPEPTRSNEPSDFNEIKRNIHDLVSFDPGLNRAVSFRLPRAESVQKKGPIEILNRSAFLAETLRKLASDPTAEATFLMLDLSDMHFADKAGAGDYVLNVFARALKRF